MARIPAGCSRTGRPPLAASLSLLAPPPRPAAARRPAAPAACSPLALGRGRLAPTSPPRLPARPSRALQLRGGAPPFATRLTSAPSLRAGRGMAPRPACRRYHTCVASKAQKRGPPRGRPLAYSHRERRSAIFSRPIAYSRSRHSDCPSVTRAPRASSARPRRRAATRRGRAPWPSAA